MKLIKAIIKGFEKYAKAIVFMGLMTFISVQVACSSIPAMTPYQACNQQQGSQLAWEKYGSLEECMSEVKAKRQLQEQRRYERQQQMAHAFDGMGRSNNMTCTPNGIGGYNCR